ncbi:BatA domain-containing protein, partial [Inquilinus limosus]
MVTLGGLVFLAPAILAALILLPVIFWLLRVTPPAPRRLSFPAIRLLLGLQAQEETPERMPWWLLLMRLLLAALIIVALAHPVLNPGSALPGSGPVLLVVDNGWASGKGWPERQEALRDAVDKAERAGRDLVLLA